jgi:hypothetical protein
MQTHIIWHLLIMDLAVHRSSRSAPFRSIPEAANRLSLGWLGWRVSSLSGAGHISTPHDSIQAQTEQRLAVPRPCFVWHNMQIVNTKHFFILHLSDLGPVTWCGPCAGIPTTWRSCPRTRPCWGPCLGSSGRSGSPA